MVNVGVLLLPVLSCQAVMTASETPATITMSSPGLAGVQKMLDAKVDPQVIQAYIMSSGITFNLTADQIIALKQRGAPDQVLTALLQHNAQLAAQAGQTGVVGQSPVSGYGTAYPNYGMAYPNSNFSTAPAYPMADQTGYLPYSDSSYAYPYTYPYPYYTYGYGGYNYPFGYPYAYNSYCYGWPYSGYYGGYFGYPFGFGFGFGHRFGDFDDFGQRGFAFNHRGFFGRGGFHNGFRNGGFVGGRNFAGARSPFAPVGGGGFRGGSARSGAFAMRNFGGFRPAFGGFHAAGGFGGAGVRGGGAHALGGFAGGGVRGGGGGGFHGGGGSHGGGGGRR